MKKSIAIPFIAGIVVAIGIFCMIAAVAPTPNGEGGYPRPVFSTNENGETYGTCSGLDPEDWPDLIAAVGINGVDGYIRDSEAHPEEEQPKNPEEAVLYMKWLEEEMRNAKESGLEYLRIIPLYAEDGITIIDQFGISFPGEVADVYEVD